MASLKLGENIEINTELILKACSLTVKAYYKSLEKVIYSWEKSWFIRCDIYGPFGKRFLVILFKCCGNTCGLKSIVKIRVIVFKHWKLLFKQQYQTPP